LFKLRNSLPEKEKRLTTAFLLPTNVFCTVLHCSLKIKIKFLKIILSTSAFHAGKDKDTADRGRRAKERIPYT
jgi:hypothetical protein